MAIPEMKTEGRKETIVNYPDSYLSLTQASFKSGLSIWQLRRLIDAGSIHGARSPRGDRVVDKEDLERFMQLRLSESIK